METSKIPANPTRRAARMLALDLAVRSAQMMGRTGNIEQVADSYYAWITKGDPEGGVESLAPLRIEIVGLPAPVIQLGAPVAAEPAPSKSEGGGVPASARQAGNKDK